jgi:hypothetical protein
LKYKCWSNLHENDAVECDYGKNEVILVNLDEGKLHTVYCLAKNDAVVNYFSSSASSSSGTMVKALPPAPTITDVRPGDTKVTLAIKNNGIDNNKYFSATKIHCWETKNAATKDTNGIQVDYTTLKVCCESAVAATIDLISEAPSASNDSNIPVFAPVSTIRTSS